MRLLPAVVSVMALAASVRAATLTVDDDGPADYTSIQAALDAASPGDTVLVADGTYRGPGNRDLDFGGRAVTLRSANGPERCIVDCEHEGRGFYFHQSETPNTVVDGLTIMNGSPIAGAGGLYCVNGASPTIRNCIIRDNQASGGVGASQGTTLTLEGCALYANSGTSEGGALHSYKATVTLIRCYVARNSALDGGGLYCDRSTVHLRDCTFEHNTAQRHGGAARILRSTPVITHCVFRRNTSGSTGGALDLYDNDSPAVTNCTFVANTAASIGGGIDFSSSGTRADLTNCAFFDHAQYAVRRSNGDPLSIQHCLFHNNQPGDLLDSGVHTGGDRIDAASDGHANNRDGRPYFSAPEDVRLTVASRHIDRGTNEPVGGLPPTDLDGQPRICDGYGGGLSLVDIGACEYNPDGSSIAVSASAVDFAYERSDPAPEPVTLHIGTGGGQPLHWRIDCNSPWLSVEPASGVCAAPWVDGANGEEANLEQLRPVTLTPHPEGLSRGLHQAKLTIHGGQTCARPRTVLVSLWVRDVLEVPGAYATIQAAVDDAIQGETVRVAPGTYHESVSIDRPITLIGVDRPVLTFNRTGRSRATPRAIWVTADHCTVEGFHISGHTEGILVSTSGNSIRNNLITDTLTGIKLGLKTSNVLVNNEIADCRSVGLDLGRATGNTLRDNRMYGSPCNFRIDCERRSNYHDDDIDTSNTVDGKPIYYLHGQSNVTLGADSNAGYVIVADCTEVRLSDLELSNNNHGIVFAAGTTASHIERCRVTGTTETGILIMDSPNNTLVDNTVSECPYGIALDRALGTTLRGNCLTDNTYNFACLGDTYFYAQDIDTSNTVDGKPIYYLHGVQDVLIDASSNAGCIYAYQCARLTIRDVVLEHNLTGITFVKTADSLIENVVARRNASAGVHLSMSPRTRLRHCLLSDNNDGLLIKNSLYQESPPTWLDHTTISGNDWGIRANDAILWLTNSHVARNASMGISCSGEIEAHVLHCAIYGNAYSQYAYPEPASIYCSGPSSHMSLTNSLVWGNPNRQIATDYDAVVEASSCNIEGGYAGPGNIDAPPLLTPDGHLQAGSPCIGAGATDSNGLPEDMDGEPRDPNDRIDIGPDQFVDTDGDTLPDWWETEYFGAATVARAGDDDDDDRHLNVTEYELYSSDPTVPAAIFYVDAARPDDSNDGLSWDTAKQTIRAALDLAQDSDRVRLAPGTYAESFSIGGRQILLEGTDPLDPEVTAATVIAGTVWLTDAEGPGCKLTGLTISNPSETGLFCSGAAPTVEHCHIVNNRGGVYSSTGYYHGGGITLANSAPTFAYCRISGNIGGAMGGGVHCQRSQPVFDHCLITGNLPDYGYGTYGAAFHIEDSEVRLDHCTVAHNSNPYRPSPTGAAIQSLRSRLRITNSILWNGPAQEVGGIESLVTVTYSDVQGGDAAIAGLVYSMGNIAGDPCFVSPGFWVEDPVYGSDHQWTPGDYHLRSLGWRWSPYFAHDTHWTWDPVTSGCIDAGHPADPLGREPTAVPGDLQGQWAQNLRVNMGAYGGTREASLAPHGWALRTDIDNDGAVRLPDFACAGRAFRHRGIGAEADVTRDGTVDYADLALMADEWLATTPWHVAPPSQTPSRGSRRGAASP